MDKAAHEQLKWLKSTNHFYPSRRIWGIHCGTEKVYIHFAVAFNGSIYVTLLTLSQCKYKSIIFAQHEFGFKCSYNSFWNMFFICFLISYFILLSTSICFVIVLVLWITNIFFHDLLHIRYLCFYPACNCNQIIGNYNHPKLHTYLYIYIVSFRTYFL